MNQTNEVTRKDFKKQLNQHIQKSGRFLSGMIMPNIGALIAWGIITALFIPVGWLPNESLVQLVDPMIFYLLPLLIGYTGGKMVYGTRGGVLGAIATMGVIVGTTIPVLIGGMIMGPLAAWVIKKFDKFIEDKIPTGFEMLINNFSAGIIGMSLTILAYVAIGPVVERLSNALGSVVETFVSTGFLPIASIFIEPAKVLFLNNAINHGVLTPLGIEEAARVGKSIFFLLETNPGPGLGILLAYWVFSKGKIKQSAPGAIIIHFFGGIHEIYFPYILMQPSLVLAAIAGGATGVATFAILGAGLVAAPAPGSIVALIAMAPKGELIPVVAGVVTATVASFLVASVLVKKRDANDELDQAKSDSKNMKVKKIPSYEAFDVDQLPRDLTILSKVKAIVVACDAGMGSSAIGASKLKSELKDRGLNIKVENYAIENIPVSTDLIITHKSLYERALSEKPFGIHIAISDFLTTKLYADLANALNKEVMNKSFEADESVKPEATLTKNNIKIGNESVDKETAIRMAGQILFEGGYVEASYIDAMVQRDSELSTYIGNGTAIPHGVSEAKKAIKHTGISILQFPDGVDFDGNIVYLVVGIAGVGNEHLMILANLAEIVEDEEQVESIRVTKEIDYIYDLFTNE